MLTKKIALLLSLIMIFTVSFVFANEVEEQNAEILTTTEVEEDTVDVAPAEGNSETNEIVDETTGDEPEIEEPAATDEEQEIKEPVLIAPNPDTTEEEATSTTSGNSGTVVGAIIAIIIVIAVVAVVAILQKK